LEEILLIEIFTSAIALAVAGIAVKKHQKLQREVYLIKSDVNLNKNHIAHLNEVDEGLFKSISVLEREVKHDIANIVKPEAPMLERKPETKSAFSTPDAKRYLTPKGKIKKEYRNYDIAKQFHKKFHLLNKS
jgi:hypothetical protein